MKLWGGRFARRETGALDTLMERFNASIGFDWRLYAAAIDGSRAYARALEQAGVLDEAERAELERGLLRVREAFDAGTFDLPAWDDEIHTAV